MGWFQDKLGKAKAAKAVANAQEEALYAQAAAEVSKGEIRAGLWAKALSAAEGEERKAHARYLALRVEQMHLQLGAASELARAQPQPSEDAEPSPRIMCMKCGGTNVHRRFAWHCRDCRTDLHGQEWRAMSS